MKKPDLDEAVALWREFHAEVGDWLSEIPTTRREYVWGGSQYAPLGWDKFLLRRSPSHILVRDA